MTLQLGFNDAADRAEARKRGLAAGGALRDRAIRLVDDNADEAWKRSAYQALEIVAMSYADFTTDDVWSVLDRWGITAPDEPRAMGGVMRRGTAAGLIRAADKAPRPSSRPECHCRPMRVWERVR